MEEKNKNYAGDGEPLLDIKNLTIHYITEDGVVRAVNGLKETYDGLTLYLIAADYDIKPEREKLRLYDGTFFPSMRDNMKESGPGHLNKFMIDDIDYIIAYVKNRQDRDYDVLKDIEKQGKTVIFLEGANLPVTAN